MYVRLHNHYPRPITVPRAKYYYRDPDALLNKPATYLILYTNIESIYIYARCVSIMGSMCLDPPSDSRHAASFRFRMSESRALHVRNYERSEADLFHFRAVMRVTLESEKVGWVAAKSIG